MILLTAFFVALVATASTVAIVALIGVALTCAGISWEDLT